MADPAASESSSNDPLLIDDFHEFFDVQILPKLLRNFSYEAELEGVDSLDGKSLGLSLTLPLDDPSYVSVELLGVSGEDVRSKWFYGATLCLTDSLPVPTGGAITVSGVLTWLLKEFFVSSCDVQESDEETGAEAPA